MDIQLKDPRFQLWFLRSCHVLTVLFFIGWVVLARFIPAPLPSESAERLAARYAGNASGIRAGAVVMMISFGLWACWGAVIASWTRRVTPTPILTYVQIVSCAISEMVGLLCAFFWGAAAFRPGQVSPEITMTLNDLGWLMFLLPWPPFSMWCIAAGIAIIRDTSAEPVFPRWVAAVSFLTAFLYIPAGACIFFKTGAFAYNGLLAMYIPLFIFFIWLEAVTYSMDKVLRRQIRRERTEREQSAAEVDATRDRRAETSAGQPALIKA